MLRIEAAGVHDLPGAYRTCLLTADAGQDASALHSDPDLLGHVYVGPYIARGTGTQLVVVDEAGAAGYLLSTDDTLEFDAWAEEAWWPPLRARYPILDDGSRGAELIRHVHEPPRTPAELVEAFPAHLHIDLQARARGTGLGRELVERLLSDLRGRGVAGVHLGVGADNANAIGFYEHLGFREVGREPGALLMGQRLGRLSYRRDASRTSSARSS
ncbi:MAG: GNAT family N-acetyltransferase [Chloroflexota bacterium]